MLLLELAAINKRWFAQGAASGAITDSVTGNDGTRFVEVTDPDGNAVKVVEIAPSSDQ